MADPGLRGLFLGPTSDGRVQFFRYLFVGGGAFAVDFLTLWTLTAAGGLHYLLSAVFAFGAGLTFNYLLSVAWVFQDRALGSRRNEFLAFALIGVVGLGLTEAGLWVLAGKAGMDYRIAKIIATILVFAWNFTARKVLLFSGRRPDTPRQPN
ncbi:MAG TPA: GtrA family protein [Holophaga sp.]|nr:GtrA family protein [Holophaga sp.]